MDENDINDRNRVLTDRIPQVLVIICFLGIKQENRQGFLQPEAILRKNTESRARKIPEDTAPKQGHGH